MNNAIQTWIAGTIFHPKQWYPSPDRKIAPTPWFVPVAQSAFIASTMLPRAARIMIAALDLLLLVSQTCSVSTGDPVKDFGRAGLIFGFIVRFVDFGLLRNNGELYKLKERDGSQVRGKEVGNEKVKSKNKSVWPKFKDSVELWLFTMRRVGWNWEVGGIPERESQSVK
jgi:hypothetical protein